MNPFVVVALVLAFAIVGFIFYKNSKKTDPVNPVPVPEPEPDSNELHFYEVEVFDKSCELIGTGIIANTHNLDDYKGEFYWNPYQQRIEKILVRISETGVYEITDYEGPGVKNCKQVDSTTTI